MYKLYTSKNLISEGEIQSTRLAVEQLKNRVESQPMSVAEFTEIKKKCDYLLKEISYMEKECEDNQKLISRYEHDTAIKRDKVGKDIDRKLRNPNISRCYEVLKTV